MEYDMVGGLEVDVAARHIGAFVTGESVINTLRMQRAWVKGVPIIRSGERSDAKLCVWSSAWMCLIRQSC